MVGLGQAALTDTLDGDGLDLRRECSWKEEAGRRPHTTYDYVDVDGTALARHYVVFIIGNGSIRRRWLRDWSCSRLQQGSRN
jgi:hypothetical protein